MVGTDDDVPAASRLAANEEVASGTPNAMKAFQRLRGRCLAALDVVEHHIETRESSDSSASVIAFRLKLRQAGAKIIERNPRHPASFVGLLFRIVGWPRVGSGTATLSDCTDQVKDFTNSEMKGPAAIYSPEFQCDDKST